MTVDEKISDVDDWINEFYATGKEAFVFMRNMYAGRGDGEEQSIIEGLQAHYEAGYCWHFAHMLKTVFQRGEVCWAAPFSHFCFVDIDGIAYDGGGRYSGEALYMIPERYCEEYIGGYKHIKGKYKDPSRNDLISIMKRYCRNEGQEYNSKAESFFNP